MWGERVGRGDEARGEVRSVRRIGIGMYRQYY